MIPEIVDAGVSPGIAIISSPTEHTHVIASSFSRRRKPFSATSIIPSSSDTGIKAPDNPPTKELAIVPPFFTASLSIARAAVVPQAPQCSSPNSSRIRPTESPTAGVGAKDRSMIPKGTLSLWEASLATSSPTRVILKAAFLIVSATTPRSCPLTVSRAALITPGPEIPTLITHSGSPGPRKAHAINVLSSGALANTTSFAQPSASLSFVASAVFLMISPISLTASILIPERVDARLIDEQTLSVTERASGIESIRRLSEMVYPFCTIAEKPPIKLTPHSLAARSSVFANIV